MDFEGTKDIHQYLSKFLDYPSSIHYALVNKRVYGYIKPNIYKSVGCTSFNDAITYGVVEILSNPKKVIHVNLMESLYKYLREHNVDYSTIHPGLAATLLFKGRGISRPPEWFVVKLSLFIKKFIQRYLAEKINIDHNNIVIEFIRDWHGSLIIKYIHITKLHDAAYKSIKGKSYKYDITWFKNSITKYINPQLIMINCNMYEHNIILMVKYDPNDDKFCEYNYKLGFHHLYNMDPECKSIKSMFLVDPGLITAKNPMACPHILTKYLSPNFIKCHGIMINTLKCVSLDIRFLPILDYFIINKHLLANYNTFVSNIKKMLGDKLIPYILLKNNYYELFIISQENLKYVFTNKQHGSRAMFVLSQKYQIPKFIDFEYQDSYNGELYLEYLIPGKVSQDSILSAIKNSIDSEKLLIKYSHLISDPDIVKIRKKIPNAKAATLKRNGNFYNSKTLKKYKESSKILPMSPKVVKKILDEI